MTFAGDIVVFTDDPGWHGKALERWFGQQGLRAQFVSLAACRLDLSRPGCGLVIPGFDAEPPVAAFVRGVPGGSLEQIVLRLDFLHQLEQLGCPVFNSGRVIERTVDKAMTSFLLRQNDLPTPATWACEDLHAARRVVSQQLAQGRSLVKKPLFGSQGNGLLRIDTAEDFRYLLPGEIAYFQEFVETRAPGFADCRVMVVAGHAIAAMERRHHHWITNRAQGANCHSITASEPVKELAVKAAAACGADYAGVDLLCAADRGWLVVEVNGIPAWRGLQKATGVDVTAALGRALLARMADPVAASA